MFGKNKNFFILILSPKFIVNFLNNKKLKKMAQSILVTEVDSSFATPKQFTTASPSFTRYPMTSTFIEFGDSDHVNTTTGIVASGFINVQYHTANQWVTGTIWVTIAGAAIQTAVNA